MLISTKGRYAVRIMQDIAVNGKEGLVKIAEISARQEITVKYAEQITALLVKGGLLRSVRGMGGGYALTKRAEEYTVLEILTKAEGDLVPVDCLSDDEFCPRGEDCVSRDLWKGLYRVIREYLSGITLQQLIDRTCDGGDQYCI